MFEPIRVRALFAIARKVFTLRSELMTFVLGAFVSQTEEVRCEARQAQKPIRQTRQKESAFLNLEVWPANLQSPLFLMVLSRRMESRRPMKNSNWLVHTRDRSPSMSQRRHPIILTSRPAAPSRRNFYLS